MLFSIQDLRLACLVPLVVCLAGCRPQEQIAKYTVPKPDLISPVSASAPAHAAAAAPQQILGAIIPVGEQSWFFKLTGDPAAVEPKREAFLDFVKTVKFAAGDKPTWTLPEAWQERPGSEFRFATIVIPPTSADDKPLEIAVSSAGGNVLDNVNRWRGQVGLARIDEAELAKTTESFEAGDKSGTFVRLVGTASGGGMGGGPFAAAASRGTAPPPMAQRKAADAGITYEVPPEWKAAPLDAISLVAFTAGEGDKSVRITLTSASGDLLTNVNRWREQIGLGPIKAADLASSVTKIETLGVQGDYVELAGPGGVAQPKTILAVMAAVRGQTWFVKLMGDSELAAREKPRFEAFVKSLKMK